MKRFTRCICLVLSLILLLAMPAQAAENDGARASNYFGSSAVYLYKTSATTFQAWFEVTCVREMDKVGAKEIKIQRSSDDENWTTMATYTMDDYYSTLIDENNCAHVACVTYTGSRGYYYRAYYKLYAQHDTGSGTWARYSSSIYIS